MANTILHKRSSVAASVPTGGSLADGELALNLADGSVYMKNSVGSVVKVGQDFSNFNAHIIPSADISYDLGSPTKQWRDIYVGPGSFYVNGQKVLEDVSGTITLSADLDQNVQIKASGTGDVELLPAGTGIIQVKGTMSILAGKNITASDGGNISFTDGINMNSNKVTGLGAPTVGSDATNKTYVDAEVGAKLDTSTFTSTYTAADVLSKLLTVDGDTSGLDADTIDGIESAALLRSDTSDTFTGAALTIDAGSTISWATAPSSANHLTNKAYVDSAISSGTLWRDSLVDSDLVDVVASNPATPEATYSISTGADVAFISTGTFTFSYGTGSTVAATPGSIVNLRVTSSGNGDYTLIEHPLAAGDRFIIAAEHGTIGSTLSGLVVGGFALTNHDLIEFTGTGDGSSAASWSTPEGRSGLAAGGTEITQGITVLVGDPDSQHYGHSYLYNAEDNAWVEIGGPGYIVAGNNLSFSGTTLNVVGGPGSGLDADTVDGIEGANILTTTGTHNKVAGSIRLNDSVKLHIGTDNDASLYYSTSGVIGTVLDVNIGNFYLRNQVGAAAETMIFAVPNGAVNLYYNGANKIQTASDGADITGNLRINSGGSITAQAIVPSANNTYDLGTNINKWNEVWATTFQGEATSAQYADLAEIYEADGEIAPGTVVCFGGEKEVTTCMHDMDRKVAGVVSTNPAYLMNSAANGVAVALQGRVPCKVSGSVKKGDMMVSDGNGGARAEENPVLGSVIGKALSDSEGDNVIEIVVGRT